jgi:regulator of RNase E activity RraA
VQVVPGDIVCADEDGVVVVPQEILDEFLPAVREAIPLEAEFDRIIREDRPLEEIRDIMRRRRAPKR